MPTEKKYQHHPKDLVLDHYHCTFFLPLIGIEKDFQPKGEQFYYTNPELVEEEAQAYHYFSPALRNILFDCGKNSGSVQAVKEWRLTKTEIESWELNLGEEEQAGDPIKYQASKIVSVRLFQYFNGIYILAVRVEPLVLDKLRQQNIFDKNDCNTMTEMAQKHDNNTAAYQQLVMENWLHFTRHVRLLYPTFPQQNDEKKIAPIHLIRQGKETITAFKDTINKKIKIHKKPGQDFSPVMCELLKTFAKEPDKVKGILENYQDLYDDRMFVSVAYGIAGKKLPDHSLQRINTLVSHVDRQDADGFDDMEGYAYTPQVILEKTKKNAFSLWEGMGGYYSFTGFSNSYLYNGWSFRNQMAPDHIPHIYDRMLIQALFYQASLRHYDQLICNETDKLLKDDDIKAIGEQCKAFVAFTNQYWFHQLTTQMQGKEIFSLQQKALGLQSHYAILKDELERTDEYLQTRREIKIAEITDKITKYGLLLALLALYYAILPIINDAVKTSTSSLWLKVNQLFAWIKWNGVPLFNDEVYGLIIMLGLIPALLVALFFLIKKDQD